MDDWQFSSSLRHNCGIFYTPDWQLFVLNNTFKVKYETVVEPLTFGKVASHIMFLAYLTQINILVSRCFQTVQR